VEVSDRSLEERTLLVSHNPERAPEPWASGPGIARSILRYWWAVLLVAAAAGGAAYAAAGAQDPVYTAEARIFLADPRNLTTGGGDTRPVIDPVRYVPQQAERVTSRPTLERAVELLEDPFDAAALDTLVVEADIDLATIEISVDSRSAERSARVANAVAAAYEQVTSERTMQDALTAASELDDARAALESRILDVERELATTDEDDPARVILVNRLQTWNAQLLDLEQRAQTLTLDAAVRGSGVDLFEPAVPPTRPSHPRPVRTALLAAALAFGLASAGAYWLAGRRRTVTDRGTPGRVLGAPLLGEIPDYGRVRGTSLVERLAVPPAAAEAYQFLLSSLDVAMAEAGGRSVVITSAGPGEGKTTTCLQLAIAGARDERSVVVADMDIRARGLTQMLGGTERPGLTEVATHRTSLEKVARSVSLASDVAVPVVLAGNELPDPSAFFRSRGFQGTVERLRQASDILLMDCAPLLAVADTVLVAQAADAVVLVVEHGTRMERLESVRQRLALLGKPLLGYVYNRSQTASETHYGDGYGDGRYAAQRKQAAEAPRKASWRTDEGFKTPPLR
jgi:capsular exopolysaccharide synthesis family protein